MHSSNWAMWASLCFFFFQAEDGIRDVAVTGVQTCALPISRQGKNFLRPALTDPTGILETAVYSSRWVEGASFVRLQNITIGYDLDVPWLTRSARSARLYASADNLVLITGYSADA